MKVHDLKIWPCYFKAILDGTKTFEVRVHNRSFWVGDVLQLREWDPKTKGYTGRHTKMSVTYMMHLDEPVCAYTTGDQRVVMAIKPVDEGTT